MPNQMATVNAATPFQKEGKPSEHGRRDTEWPRVSPPLLAVLNALLLALVVVEVWPQFAGDGPTWGTRGTWGVQQPIEALLGSPGVARGHHDGNSSATQAPSHAADRPSNAALAPFYAALEQDICWSSEPVVTSSIRRPAAAAVAATGEAAEAAAAAEATGGVVVGGRGCSRCMRGEQCSFHVWVRPPAFWVLPPVANASSERENSGEGGSGAEGESSSGSSGGSGGIESSWWKKDVTLSLLGPALGHGEVQCLDPPSCSHLLASYRLWDAGTYR
ncbi:unnamed protein product [Closterium sp. NIES-53]